ncbi:MAG TPA: hypothetical protein VF576_03730, partial [Rubricoccaceae bacterium]
MPTGTDHAVLTLEWGIRAAQQGLYQVHRGSPRDTGLSLHLAAFAAVCLGIRQAYEAEMDLVDLHPRIERALRHLGAAWDERPVVRPRRSLLTSLLHLGSPDADALRGTVQDSAALAIAVPGVDRPEPGDRGDVLVACYHRYVDGVYVYCCDRRGANTWDDGGLPFALERALFADLGVAPPPLDEEA